MAKFKQIGGSPYEISADEKDILVWLQCLENKSHPTYLNTPYNLVQGQRCPICDSREPIIAYIIRYYVGKTQDDKVKCTVIKGAVTTIEEAKDEVVNIFKKIIRQKCHNVIVNDLVMFEDIAPSCHCGSNMIETDGNVEIVARMSGEFDKGEFFIDIVKA